MIDCILLYFICYTKEDLKKEKYTKIKSIFNELSPTQRAFLNIKMILKQESNISVLDNQCKWHHKMDYNK